MGSTKPTVSDGMSVSMDYTLKLDDGEVIDTSVGREPLEFLFGYGQIIPGLERELQGMELGQEKDVTVEAAEGYGQVDPQAFQRVPRNLFPESMELQEDMMLNMRDAESGEVFPARIEQIGSDSVVLDLNHPLAGETLYFNVKIAGLRAATPEEIAHGHVHSGDAE
jgi:FKBP-type peptidyl-prolyl cis-trans isomerase SlyD